MERIVIHDLEIRFRVGTIDKERSWPQRLLLTIELECDLSQAMLSDNLTHTIDYEQLVKRLREWGDQHEWKLLETLTSDIADFILQNFHPHSVSLVLKKFELPMTNGVSVQIINRQKPLKTIS